MKVTSARYNADGSLGLTGHRAWTIGCGGPEWHFGYGVATATETAHAGRGAAITVTPLPMERPAVRSLPAARLPGYLAADQDTRIFEVTGPLTAITGMQEMYHP